jgi:DNA-binding NarL/FixJ family response regulator
LADGAESSSKQAVMKPFPLRRSSSQKPDRSSSLSDESLRTGAQLKLNEAPGSKTRADSGRRPQSVKPYIVVIHRRAFIRECFARCLETSYTGHDVVALDDISAWRDLGDANPISPTVIVYFVDSSDPSSFSDLDVLEKIAAETPILIVSDTEDVNDVVRAFKSGVRGYIPTSLPFSVVVEVVRLVEAGGTYVPASLAFKEKPSEDACKTCDLLTERQLKVVGALCQGMANKQIAYTLSMSEHTVKVHLRHIMRKLKARNRTEVAILSQSLLQFS